MTTQPKNGLQASGLTRSRQLWLLLACLALFLLLAWQVRSDGSLLRIDFWLQQGMQPLRTPSLVNAASLLTLLGSTSWAAGLAVLASMPLIWKRYWYSLAGVWVTMIGAGLSVLALKGLIYRPRPAGLDGAIADTSSFPSGNSLLAAALIGALILLVVPQILHGRSMRLAICILAPLPVLVAASRVILSAHYLSDTIAGLAVGLAWALIGSLVARRK